MKIGVYLGAGNPVAQAGGGFTFQDSLLQALHEYSGEHVFYLYYQGVAKQSDNASIFYRPLSKYITSNSSIIKKAWCKILRTIDSYFAKKNFKTLLNRAAQQDKIELMWFMMPVHQQVDVPYVFTIWDLQHRLQSFFPEVSQNGTFDKRECFYRTVIQQAAYVVVGNQTAKEEVIRFYGMPDDRVKAIEFPTPPFALKKNDDGFDIKKRFAISQAYLFYPAQFWPHKNHVVLVEALKLLHEQHGQDIVLVFTGSDKGNKDYIEQLVCEYGLEEYVYFLGFVSIQELKALYKNALALVYSSYFGPNNIPPLEAMALLCPVITADVAGMREQLGDAALYFDPRDSVGIVQHILLIQQDSALRNSLIEKGLRRAGSWTNKDYLRSILDIVNDFAPRRKCWSSKEKYFEI